MTVANKKMTKRSWPRMARHSIRGTGPRAFAAAAVLVLSVAGSTRADPAEARRPNILLIVTDDQGYADFGFQGSPSVRTPHIDALAGAGVRLTNAYVSHPYCSPTRAGLLTGRYQQRFGHENNPAFLPDNEEIGLPVGELTLADVLGGAGYATAVIGKWHLGAGPPFHPRRRGFDEFFGFLGGGHNYFEDGGTGAGGGISTAEYTAALEHNGRHVSPTDYLTDAFSRQAEDFIRRHRDRPFFLYLAFNAPHTPYQAPEHYRQRFAEIDDGECRTYAAMISAVDDGIGRVVKTLRELEIDQQTLIFLLSDNGGQARDTCPDNTPLRGGKGGLYEGGIRVPFVVAWPGRLTAGSTYKALVSSLDVFATAAALAGPLAGRSAPGAPTKPDVDGVDLMPFLTGRQTGVPRRALYWRVAGGVGWAVRRDRWKLIGKRRGAELYDLDADAGETRSLAPERPDLVRELAALYRDWNAKMVPPRWRNPS